MTVLELLLIGGAALAGGVGLAWLRTREGPARARNAPADMDGVEQWLSHLVRPENAVSPAGLELLYEIRWDLVVGRIAWSPDGERIAAIRSDATIVIWSWRSRRDFAVLSGHTDRVRGIAWAADSRRLASVALDGTLRIWNVLDGSSVLLIEGDEALFAVAWQPGGELIAVSGKNPLKIVHSADGTLYRAFSGIHVEALDWSGDGRFLAWAEYLGSVILQDVTEAQPRTTLARSAVVNIRWSPDGRFVATGARSSPYEVTIWDAQSGRSVVSLEDHSNVISALAFSSDGRFLAAKSYNDIVYLYRCDTWQRVASFVERTHEQIKGGLSFHPSEPLLATLCHDDRGVRIWGLEPGLAIGPGVEDSVRQVAAKVVLVGEAGVGKSSLGWRLAHGTFKEHSSTHGQQFWVLETLRTMREDGVSCEAILWDLAGQPDYRLVHSLFLDDAELALVLFNPADHHEPMRGVDYWLRALARQRPRPCRVILVGARTDRGEPSLTRAEIQRFCNERGVAAYVPTSAATGEGIAELIEQMKHNIAWDQMTLAVTTLAFKHIKELVLELKEKPTTGSVLLNRAELAGALQATGPGVSVTEDEIITAVGYLAAYGYVRILRTASGDERILLQPELLNNLASSMVLEARRNPKGLGSLDERALLSGGYSFPELAPLSHDEVEVLIDSAEILFLEHNVCFRESLGNRVFLVFPELINLKKPLLDGDEPTVDDVSYVIRGPVTNVYAALVVRLGYTNIFTRTDQWFNQAQYEVASGETCGFRQVADREGEIEIVLYYARTVGASVRLVFQGLIEKFLESRPLEVKRYPPLDCAKCRYRQERAEVVRRVEEGLPSLFCSNCGNEIALSPSGPGTEVETHVRALLGNEQTTATLRTRFEAAQVQLLSFIRSERPEHTSPDCFVSYAWGVPEQERWVEKKLASDLRRAGIEIVLDRWHNAEIGADVARFVSRIEQARNVIVVGTPLYRQKYENKLSSTGSVVAAEVDLINIRLIGTQDQKRTVKPVLLDGTSETSLPPLMRGKVYGDFRDELRYFSTLFDLILTLYAIPFDSKAVTDLRETLTLSA